jgi:poly [ADP-ribose] polymerase|eukprot:COSAG06_NODE_907_length_11611_cov_13.405316_7_plen_191_part_00
MTKADCLVGTVICISGALSVSKSEMTATLKGAGATVAGSFTAKVTHVLSTPEDVAKGTAKVTSAIAKGLPVVGESFVTASLKAGKKVSEKSHLLSATATAGPKKTIAKKTKAKPTAKKKAGAKKKKAAASAAATADAAEQQEPTVVVPAAAVGGGDDITVCVDAAGEYLEAQLSQIEVKSNTDKFYTTQV